MESPFPSKFSVEVLLVKYWKTWILLNALAERYLNGPVSLMVEYLWRWPLLHGWNVSSLQSLFQGIEGLALLVEDFSAYWLMSYLRHKERMSFGKEDSEQVFPELWEGALIPAWLSWSLVDAAITVQCITVLV